MDLFLLGVRIKIVKGYFTSVVIHQNLLYAAETNENTVYVFYCDSNWKVKNKINLHFQMNRWTVTLCVRDDRLICSSGSWLGDMIQVYTLKGRFLQTYGTRGSGEAGQFRRPYICDAVDAGSVLIADCYNGKLQVLSEQGEFSGHMHKHCRLSSREFKLKLERMLT